jgi:hypothetical protein
VPSNDFATWAAASSPLNGFLYRGLGVTITLNCIITDLCNFIKITWDENGKLQGKDRLFISCTIVTRMLGMLPLHFRKKGASASIDYFHPSMIFQFKASASDQ